MRQIGVGGAATGTLPDLHLSALPASEPFNPTDRVPGNTGNYRMVGPVLSAPAGQDRVLIRVRVPLRPGAVAAGSPHLGVTLTLAVVRMTGATQGAVIRRESVTVTQGMTEAVFGGGTIPAGEAHAHLVGVEEGAWDAHIALLYGAGDPSAPVPYSAPYGGTASGATDSVAPTVGQPWTLETRDTARHRTVLCEAAGGVPKNVRGPLDGSDFPVVTSLDQLLAGQVALLDNGTDPPRLVRKRLDGSAPPVGLPAVDGASLTGTGAPGAPLAAAVTPARFYDTERRVRATLDAQALTVPRFAGKVRRGEPVTVLLIGSSSLTQSGASSAAAAFEPQFTAALKAAFPNVAITVVNKGVGGFRLPDLEARYSGEYVPVNPDLTIVVIGVNDGIQQSPALDEFRLRYEALARSLSRYGSDVICVDGQMWRDESEVNRRYNAAIRDAATAADVAFFSRRDMMQQAILRGEYTLADMKFNGGIDLHDNDTGYALWASSVAASVVHSVRLHGDTVKAQLVEFSAEQPLFVTPTVPHRVYRPTSAPFDVAYDLLTLTAGVPVVVSTLFRGTGIRWLPFEGAQNEHLTQVRFRIDQGDWRTLPLPRGGAVRGGAWTLVRDLVDTLHLIELELTSAGGGDVFQGGFEVLTPADTAAVGSSLAAGGRMLVAQGAQVTAAGNMNINVSLGTLLVHGRAVKAKTGDNGVNVALPAADAANPRIDLIYHAWDGVRVITGAPAASPAVPSLPHEGVVLAEVLVPAGATALGTITDRRVRPAQPTAARLKVMLTVPKTTRAAGTSDYWTPIPIAGLSNVVGGWLSTADGWLTVPRTATYLLSISYVINGGSQYYNLAVLKADGSEVMKVSEGNGNTPGGTASGLITLTAGDRIRLNLSSGAESVLRESNLTKWALYQMPE